DCAVGDLDGDGDTDALFANGLGGANQVWHFGCGLRATNGSPQNETVGVASGTPVEVYFDADLNTSSVSDSNFVVRSMQHGTVSGTISFPDLQTARFVPNRSWFPGEVIRVTLDTSIQSITGARLNPFNLTFTAATRPLSCLTFRNSGQMLGPEFSVSVALADVNGDGDLDAWFGNGFAAGTMDRLWLNDGTGQFTDSGQSLNNQAGRVVNFGDLNGDGTPDVLAAGTGPLQVWGNDGTGSFSSIVQPGGSGPRNGAALGDLDGDGDLDVISARAGPSLVRLNDGSGVFLNSGQSLGLDLNQDVALADLDQDGDLDALTANGSGSSQVYINLGAAVFIEGDVVANTQAGAVALGDLNGDGAADAFFANGSLRPNTIWLNNGDGTFTDSGQMLGGSASLDVALGDVDGDGDLDAWVANDGDSDRLWLNDGTGAMTDSGIDAGSANTRGVALGDLDGDGDLDVVKALSSGENQIWLNGCPDLAVLKTGDPAVLQFTNRIQYILTVRNLGDAPAFDVIVIDTLPSNVIYEANSSAPNCTASNSQVTCLLGDLAPGAETNLLIEVTVQNGISEWITNEVTASLTNLEVSPTNNMAFATTRLPDTDTDGLRDFEDPDADNDGVSNETEIVAGTDPFDADSILAIQSIG
ncbi:MAG: FG-GAP-like repeat-containing protein, partial [Verrucomicrobiota bacterium]